MSLLRKLVWTLGVFLPAAVLVVLAITNRHSVDLVLDPFAETDAALTVAMPVFLLFFGALAVGLLLGGFSTWLGQGRWRRKARQSSNEANRLRSEVDRLNAQVEQSDQARLPAPTNGE